MVRDEAREKVRGVEGREISQVTVKGDPLKGFAWGSHLLKAFSGCCVESRLKRSQNRGQRADTVVQVGDEPPLGRLAAAPAAAHAQGA